MPSLKDEFNEIEIRGACEHNLKNIDIDIPKKNLVVITGVSGSGKSSLAFDTIFAEGQRRYVESLSSYARQFLGQMEKPKYETIRGLAPTIAIEQKAASKNPRSTVGTITEIYDYLRVLFARVGVQHCIKCGKKVGRGDAASMVQQILEIPPATKILILAPLVTHRKGEHRDLLERLKQDGYRRVRIDGVVTDLQNVQALAKNKKHNIEAVIDRLTIKTDKTFHKRLVDSVEAALKMAGGKLIVHVVEREDIPMSAERTCCDIAYPELDPPLFSFNSPLGMCSCCNGLGSVLSMEVDKIIEDPNLSIRQGAIKPWQSFFDKGKLKTKSWGGKRIDALQKTCGLDIDKPWKKLSKTTRELIMYGPKSGKVELKITWKGNKGSGNWTIEENGLVNRLNKRYRQTTSERQKAYYQQFMSNQACKECQGARLKPAILHVKFREHNIHSLCQLTVGDAHELFKKIKLTGNEKVIASEVLKEVSARLSFLVNVGLQYLSLDRKGPTLSGGEAQRIRLASQIGTELTGVLYVLDEPSIGLHQRDNQRLLATLCRLRDIGNSLLVVEHDRETIEAADWVIDIGPGAGHLGGQIVAQGKPKQIQRQKTSLTGQYLTGKKSIAVPKSRRRVGERKITIYGAQENNLNVKRCEIPLGLFVGVTGVSGAGKSTLINQILYPALARKLHQSDLYVGKHASIDGLENIDKVVNIDQKPIGRTPRSNPATYTKLFDLIRDFFALLPESRARGYKKGRFSFNVSGGRCENCSGDGFIKVEMHFLPDVFVPCETCKGKRFNPQTLEINYKGHNIADILDLSVGQAREVFANHPAIIKILETLNEVGLSYIKLGQPATTLSGGEAQRVKLARELAKKSTGKTFYILDEPTTGLHFEDIKNLLKVLQLLVDQGNTVLVIEHNTDVIKTTDWILDLGPEGGSAGGQLLTCGTPEKVAKVKKSHTGNALIGLL